MRTPFAAALLAAFLALAAAGSRATAQAPAQNRRSANVTPLVAEVYPGAVPLYKPSGADVSPRKWTRYYDGFDHEWYYRGVNLTSLAAGGAGVYLTTDPAAKVVEFYRRKIPRVDRRGSDEFYLVARALGGGEGDSGFVGVHVFGAAPQSNSGGFDELSEPISAGYGKHTQAEVEQLSTRYGHLQRAWFNLTDERDSSSGNFLDYQQRLYAEYQARANAQADQARGQNAEHKIMELIQQGRVEEARALMTQAVQRGQRAAEGSGEFDTFPLWREYLEKLDANAYATLVIIEPLPATRQRSR